MGADREAGKSYGIMILRFNSSAGVASGWIQRRWTNLSILVECMYLNKIPIITVQYCISSQVELNRPS